VSVTPPSITAPAPPVLRLGGRTWHVWPDPRSGEGKQGDPGADEANAGNAEQAARDGA